MEVTRETILNMILNDEKDYFVSHLALAYENATEQQRRIILETFPAYFKNYKSVK